MATVSEIVVTLPGGRRVDAQVRGHVVRTDQPVDNGGEDSAPSPFELFLASLGTCAGIFVQGFCARRGIPTDGIRVVERPRVDPGTGELTAVELDVELPPSFPEKYRDAVLRAVEGCSVKRAIAAQPGIVTRAVVAG
jgi:ribosomal protein S12 methylthiotransferase accessory factor